MLKRVILIAACVSAVVVAGIWLFDRQPVIQETGKSAETQRMKPRPPRPGTLNLPSSPPRKANIEPGALRKAADAPRAQPEMRIVDGIEMVRGETLNGEEIWIPTAPTPPAEEPVEARIEDDEELLLGPEP